MASALQSKIDALDFSHITYATTGNPSEKDSLDWRLLVGFPTLPSGVHLKVFDGSNYVHHDMIEFATIGTTINAYVTLEEGFSSYEKHFTISVIQK